MTAPTRDARGMTWPGLIGLLSAFLLVPSFVSVIFLDSQSERLFPDAHAGLKVAIVHAVGTAIVAIAITVKGWWPLVLGVLMIAIGEELMFRGVWVVCLRGRMGELAVALVSSAAFGLSHVLAGPVQVVLSMMFGLVLSVTRRVSGGPLAPVLVHLAWDLSVFTAFLTEDPADGSDASVALTLVNLALVVVIAVGWRRLGRSAAVGPADASS